MKHRIIPLLGLVLWHGMAVAQDDIPMLRPEERAAVDNQTDEFNDSLLPALTHAAKSTVRVWAGSRRLAYGTVVADGRKVLTKWSEVARFANNLRVESAGGTVMGAQPKGVYEDEDLVLLELSGGPLTPVEWSPQSPRLGSFLAAPQPDGRPAAFGVVSVLERNLRDTDQAYLGVIGAMNFAGPGVKIEEVAKASAAATAGLKPGQIILKVNQRPISGVLELRNALVGIAPGSTVTLLVKSRDGEKSLDVQVGNRPEMPNLSGARLRQMEQMGGPTSRVRDSFTRVIQSDMRPQPSQIGGPVVDLKGRVVGITMARADRTRAFIMPAAAVAELLAKQPQDPSVAKVRQPDNRTMAARGSNRQPPGRAAADPERMRRHMQEMQRLMEHLQEELDTLEMER